MLINVRISELTTDNSNSIPLAIMIGIFFNVTLYKLLPTNLSSIFNIYAYSKAASVNNMSYTTHYTPMNIKDLKGPQQIPIGYQVKRTWEWVGVEKLMTTRPSFTIKTNKKKKYYTSID